MRLEDIEGLGGKCMAHHWHNLIFEKLDFLLSQRYVLMRDGTGELYSLMLPSYVPRNNINSLIYSYKLDFYHIFTERADTEAAEPTPPQEAC